MFQHHQVNTYQQHTRETFMALVDAVIPRTPRFAQVYGSIQYYGALDLEMYEFMINTLDHYTIPLASPTADLLDSAADQLILYGENVQPLDDSTYPEGGTFTALAPSDRFRAIEILEQLRVNMSAMPIPFQNNPYLITSIADGLSRLTMLGYYSEWSGYGTTRLENPNNRVLEYYPISWQQVDYPGPSLGYREFRGYYVEEFIE